MSVGWRTAVSGGRISSVHGLSSCIRAVDALAAAADGEVTEAHVTAVIGPTGWDPAAGAAAAREFLRV